MQLILAAFIVLNYLYRLPIWIYTIMVNIVSYVAYYYVFIYSDSRLKNEVITEFANDMSDGLILYNKYNELIHVNDLVKNTLDAGFLTEINDIRKLEKWVSQVELVENIETLPYKKGGEDIYFIVRKVLVGNDKRPIGTVYILHDTTVSINQIRLMEKVNDELERTSKMKSDFLANMSHELRTPMNAVIGMAEIALREESSPRVRDCLNQINHSGRNLLNIINDILDYSKIDAGKMEIVEEKYEPLSEVNDISNILQTRIGEKNLELFFIVDPTLPHELVGDAMRIRQVLINIANNAIKFTERGIIKISLACERLSEDEMMLHFHVIDTGQGIKKDDLEKLFVSFQQVDSKRNRNVEGTGLGLAISKRLCEAMNGTIGVESEYGKGSDFWFDIPQKIADDSHDLKVEDAENKFAFCLNERNLMITEFEKEMEALGLGSKIITDLSLYKPTGKKDYLFIEERFYTPEMEKFFEDNPLVTGVILTGFGSTFIPNNDNVRVMSKPQTTLSMVLILNNREISSLNFASGSEGNISFTAPDVKVLVVDDNTINLSIAVGLLEPLKVKTDVAQSGPEAIEKVNNYKYDIILMDHMMPGMDGIETTEEIKKLPNAKDSLIVALTANVVEGSRELFLNAGMVDMIAKPIEVKQLYSKMATLIPDGKKKKPDNNEMAAKREANSDYINFDCLDCEKAIKGLGSEVLFQKIVGEYYKRGNTILSEIEKAHDNNDYADYAIKTHALKSSSRQIGATKLGDLAEKLEYAGKAEDDEEISRYHGEAMDTYRKLLADLAKYFPEEEKKELPPITDDELKTIFDELSDACDNLEMDGMEACAEKLKSYSYDESRAELIEKLYGAIEDIDADACIELMKEIIG
ncbi:MAG: response regulator [Lachnospiraceae bacterium]|nr:response regulator [Lachnospiraceae bacterium]